MRPARHNLPSNDEVRSDRDLTSAGGAIIALANISADTGPLPADPQAKRAFLDGVIASKVGPARQEAGTQPDAPSSEPQVEDLLAGRERFEQNLYGHVLTADEIEGIIEKRRSELRSHIGLGDEAVDQYLQDDLELLELKRAKEQAAGEQA